MQQALKNLEKGPYASGGKILESDREQSNIDVTGNGGCSALFLVLQNHKYQYKSLFS